MELSKCQPKLHLFKNVKNTATIRSKVLNKEICCAALNPINVLDQFQVLTATHQALSNFSYGTMKTRSIYSEIIYNMSPNKKISDSLNRFGIKDSDTDILFVLLNEMSGEELEQIVEGDSVDITNLDEICDEKEVKKIYKVKDEELTVGSLLDAVINRISTKEIVTF